MNNDTLEQAWQDICDKVKSYPDVDSSQINAFFSRLQPQAISDGFLMLTTDSDFIKKWIELHFLDVIKRALEDLYSVPFTVSIEIDISNSSSAPAELSKATTNVYETSHEEESSSPTVATEAHGVSEQQEQFEEPEEPVKQSAVSPLQGGESPISTLTFENFVIGDSNRMAYSMAVAVAETPGKSPLNPLFIYGKSGLGKTHLMRAIQNYIDEATPEISALYVDSAEFLSDYMEATAEHDKEKSSYKNFKQRYEDVDVLLIDDVQYLQGKKQTLDIVFQIFNKLISEGRQVVLSADRSPKNIDIDERYKSRFNSGGTFDIQPPEVETKFGIIKSFIKEYKEMEGNSSFNISDDILMYIAENSSSNIRELKSAVTKVIYQMTTFNKQSITLDEVKSILENHFSGGLSKRITIADIQKEIEAFYKISHADLIGQKRNRNIIYARQVAIYLCRQMLDLPFNDIGKKFNRDHSTVMYSVTNIEDKMKENRELREELETLRQLIREA